MAQQQGMFGPSVEELQRSLMEQQQLSDFNQARMFGQMDLGQQIGTAAYGGGLGITRGLGQLGQATGYIPEDPRIAEARRLMQIKQEMADANIDPQDIDKFYPEMIRRLNAAGFPEQANRAMQQYTQAQTAQGNLEARRAEAEARRLAAEQRRLDQEMPGLKVARDLTDSIQKNPRNARVVAEFRQTVTPQNPGGDLTILDKLELPEDKEKYTPLFYNQNNEPVYRDKGGTYTLKMISDPQQGGGLVQFKQYGTYTQRPPTAPSTTVNLNDDKKSLAQYNARLAVIKPSMDTLTKNATIANESSARLDNLINIVQTNPIFSGFGADLQTNVARFLQTWGGLDLSKGKIETSQIVDALVGPEILANMQQLGGQDSNEELRKITAMSPNRAMNKDALLHTATVARQAANRTLLRYQNLSDFTRSGRDVTDFDFAKGYVEGQPDPMKQFPIPVWDSVTMKSYPTKEAAKAARETAAVSKLSDEELAERIRKAREGGSK